MEKKKTTKPINSMIIETIQGSFILYDYHDGQSVNGYS